MFAILYSGEYCICFESLLYWNCRKKRRNGKREERKMFLPEKIYSLVAEEQYQTDDIGMSDSSVLLDLGKTGIADKWCDIALCYRSLSNNYSGKYKHRRNRIDSEYDDLLLFRKLGIEPDWEKIRYYILLDELF